MDFGIGTNLTGAVVAPFNSQQKQPVGEQNSDALESSLPPVEQVDKGAAGKRLSDERRQEVEQRSDRDQHNDRLEKIRIDDEVRALARRDSRVKSHESTHAALAGRYAGAARYEFKKGPNGVLYAVAGSVSIDTAPVPDDPEATLRKAQVIKRAALGPSDPSAADRAIAGSASSMAAEAAADLAREGRVDREQADAAKGAPERVPERVPERLPEGLSGGPPESVREDEAGDQRAAVTAQADEESDSTGEQDEEKEAVKHEIEEAELSKHLIDAALNKKLVELGVFKASDSTGTALDLTA